MGSVVVFRGRRIMRTGKTVFVLTCPQTVICAKHLNGLLRWQQGRVSIVTNANLAILYMLTD
jgi:hypothetical protein